MMKAVVCVLLLLVAVKTADSIKCYQCVLCSQDPYSKPNSDLSSCSSGVTKCKKVRTDLSILGITYSRSCATVGETGSGCTENGNVVTCYCEGESCNGGHHLKPGFLFVVGLAGIMAKLMVN